MLVGKYYYDGEGKRVKKKLYDSTGVEQEEITFVYDGMGKLVAEDSTKPPPANPTTSFTATDQLGSPRVIANSLGEVISLEKGSANAITKFISSQGRISRA